MRICNTFYDEYSFNKQPLLFVAKCKHPLSPDQSGSKDLSYLLGVRVSSLNELLSKLEKSGHVTREPSEQDKRVMLVKLTEKGNAQQPQTDHTADISDIFDCLTDEEQAVFGACLDKIIDALGARLGFDDEEFEWLKAAQDERSRMFAEMHERGFDFHGFHGGFGHMGGFRRGGFAHMGGFGKHCHNKDDKNGEKK